jgi:hypothetical protein
VDGKLSYYDIVAHVVPGTLVLGVLALVPEVFRFSVPSPKSDAITLAAGLPVTYAVGQGVQAVSSFMQPLYYRLWRGMPSQVILEGGSKRLHGERLDKIITALGRHLDSRTDTPAERAAIFSFAMAMCNRDGLGRVDDFNASYAFHRALLTTGVLTTIMLAVALVLSELGVASATSAFQPALVYLLVLSLILTVIEFIRARQRGEYFSIEVLDMAYIQCIQGSPGATPGTG